ncbi:MAG: ATP-binding protein [Methanosarcinaceae archaeon]|nr:ATP-binding protein [Methanosarcinaceae archaeon]
MNFEGKNHRDTLKEKLLRDSKDLLETIKTDEKLKDIYTKLEYIKLGELKYRNNIARYEADDLSINAENIAAGLKTFVIIKTLLENGSLENDGTMILDEPEIHLHPKWQLLLAELIVLIQKVFNMHILLNTHSPYFLHAIEVYSKHHGISKKCRYYLTELDEEEKTAHIKEVTGNTEEIYKLLAEPFDTLELI